MSSNGDVDPDSVGNWEYRFIGKRDDIRQLAYLLHESPEDFEDFRINHDLEKSYARAVSKKYEESARDNFNPVEDVFSSIKDCTKALENIPFKIFRDEAQKGKLHEEILPLKRAIQEILEQIGVEDAE